MEGGKDLWKALDLPKGLRDQDGLGVLAMRFVTIWVWLKIKDLGQTAGFGPCFHLPGFHHLVLNRRRKNHAAGFYF